LPLLVALAIVALDALGLAMARSGTAIIAAIAGLAAGMVLLPIRSRTLRMVWRVTALFTMVVAMGVAIVGIDQVYVLLGRDSSMTGRSQMWAQVYDMTFQHIVGTGYGTGGGSQVSIEIQKAMNRQDTLGVQSGYLNLALELGWPAVGLFLFWLGSAMGTTFLARQPSPAQPLFVALAVQHLIGSYSESFGGIYPSWSLAVLLAALIAARLSSPVRWAPRRRSRRAAAAMTG
jgi:O-antigen ligase